MYMIGNVVLGTYLPQDDQKVRDVMEAYAADPDFLKLVEEYNPGVTHDDLKVDAENGELEIWDFVDDVWTKLYHGAARHPIAYVGVELGTFDEASDHFPLSDLTGMVPSAQQRLKARKAYDSLPQGVRDVLPPFDVYIVWSSS